MSTSDFIPNSFQTPNAYVDQFLSYLTPEEWKVLTYFVRRIFGFNKRQDRISISQLSDGIRTHQGEIKDLGTGLSAGACRKATDTLCIFRLLVLVEKNDPHKNEGCLYELQLDSSKVDTLGLRSRAAKHHVDSLERTQEARKAINPSSATVVPPSSATVVPPSSATVVPPSSATVVPPSSRTATQYTDQNPDQNPGMEEVEYESDPDEIFHRMQTLCETLTGRLCTPGDIPTIDRFIQEGVTKEDIQGALAWRESQKLRPVNNIRMIEAGALRNKAARVQSAAAASAPKPDHSSKPMSTLDKSLAAGRAAMAEALEEERLAHVNQG